MTMSLKILRFRNIILRMKKKRFQTVHCKLGVRNPTMILQGFWETQNQKYFLFSHLIVIRLCKTKGRTIDWVCQKMSHYRILVQKCQNHERNSKPKERKKTKSKNGVNLVQVNTYHKGNTSIKREEILHISQKSHTQIEIVPCQDRKCFIFIVSFQCAYQRICIDWYCWFNNVCNCNAR